MTDTPSVPDDAAASLTPGLFARFTGVIFSPSETYAAVAARPRSLGIIVLVVGIVVLAQGIFLSTEVGQQAALDQNIRAMEAFGVQVPDQAYAQMEQNMRWAPITGGISAIVFWPLMMAIVAGLLTGAFSTLMGGNATFRQVFAVVAHSSVIVALQQLFSMPLSYATGEFSGANLGVFVPMLEERSFLALLLGSIDLFMLWFLVNLSIGIAVLYRRRTGGIATTLIGIYVAIVLLIAVWRA